MPKRWPRSSAVLRLTGNTPYIRDQPPLGVTACPSTLEGYLAAGWVPYHSVGSPERFFRHVARISAMLAIGGL